MVKLLNSLRGLFRFGSVDYNVIILGDNVEDQGSTIRGVKLNVKPNTGDKIYFNDEGPFYVIVNIMHRIYNNTHTVWITVEEI